MKLLKIRTKIEIMLVTLFLLTISFSSLLASVDVRFGTDGSGQDWFGITNGLITNSNGKAFAATGTGLQEAIWDLNVTGGVVDIPAAQILIATTINISNVVADGLKIVGSSESSSSTNGTVLRTSNNANCDIFECTVPLNTNVHLIIENIMFDGNKVNQVSACNLITMTRAEEFVIRDCVFVNSKQFGVELSAVEVGEIKNCLFTNCDDDLIRMAGSATVIISECDLINANANCLDIRNNCNDVVISGNHISSYNSGDHGINLYNGVNLCKIFGNSIAWCDNNAISFNTKCSNNTVVGNVFERNGKVTNCDITLNDGGKSDACCFNTFTGNWFGDTNSTVACNYGIAFQGYSHNNTVSGNTIYDMEVNSILFNTNTRDNIVVGNVLFDGVSDSSGGANTFTGNQINGEFHFNIPVVNATSGHVSGFTWFNTSSNVLYVYNGSAWVSTTLT